MRLKSVKIQRFRNIVALQSFDVEDDVTCLVGKNESGKTTILDALHRLNPANPAKGPFDLTTEYPRWRLSPDRRANPTLAQTTPIEAIFALTETDLPVLETIFGARPPLNSLIHAAKSYENKFLVWMSADPLDVITAVGRLSGVAEEDLAQLVQDGGLDNSAVIARSLAKDLRAAGDSGRATALTAYATSLPSYAYLRQITDQAQRNSLAALIPKFFYFSSYDELPGECDLTALSEKIAASGQLTPHERTVVSLLAHAGESPADFLDANYDSRKAELQAASSDLSRQAFEY